MDELEARINILQEQNSALQKQLSDLLATTKPLLEHNAALQAQLASQDCTQPTYTTPTIIPAPSSISAVVPKLPPFWIDRPQSWFTRIESQFNLAGIKADQTKFDYVIAQLDHRLIGEIDDIVADPPATDRYGKLKNELIRRLSMSEAQRVRQLIDNEELNGRKPSQFLRHLRSLASPDLKDDNIIKELWMRRLPKFLIAILTAQAELTLDKLAQLADSILEVSPGVLTNPNAVFASSTPDQNFSARLDELTRQVAALTRNRHRDRSYHRRSRSSSRTRHNSQHAESSDKTSPKVCWYHKKFQSNATKCVAPCAWVALKGNETGSR